MEEIDLSSDGKRKPSEETLKLVRQRMDQSLTDTGRMRIEDVLPAIDPVSGEERDPILTLRKAGISPTDFAARLKRMAGVPKLWIEKLPWWANMLIGAGFTLFAWVLALVLIEVLA